jgi:hypothetical protein
MAVRMYVQEFYVGRKTYEAESDVRNRALAEVNKFFFSRDSVDIVNVIERWNADFDFLKLIVYYKGYV